MSIKEFPKRGVSDQTLESIKELNLSFLVLAQKIVQENRVMAKIHLGMDDRGCEIMDCMTPQQLIRMANSPMVLCKLRFDDSKVLESMESAKKEPRLSILHSHLVALSKEASV